MEEYEVTEHTLHCEVDEPLDALIDELHDCLELSYGN